MSACRLTEKGYSVGVREMGRRWTEQDFPETPSGTTGATNTLLVAPAIVRDEGSWAGVSYWKRVRHPLVFLRLSNPVGFARDADLTITALAEHAMLFIPALSSLPAANTSERVHQAAQATGLSPAPRNRSALRRRRAVGLRA